MWSALRINYFEPDLSGLISQCVHPLTADVRARFAPETILLWSHWKRGLHVNLACRIDTSQQALFEERCVSRISDWLGRHPSTSTLDHAAYIDSSQDLGRLEGDAGPFGPLRTNNTVEMFTYLTRDVAGSRALGILWERFLDSSLDLILELAALRRKDTEAFYKSLTALFATIGAFGGPHGLAHGHLSFRAHAEGLLATSPKVQSVFDRADKALGPLVACALRDALSPAYAPPPWLENWRIALRQINDDIGSVIEAESAFEPEVAESTFILASSALGTAMQSAEARTLFASVTHRQYRTLVNFFYRILPTIGLSPLERARFAYVFAARCRDILNVDWESIFYKDQN